MITTLILLVWAAIGAGAFLYKVYHHRRHWLRDWSTWAMVPVAAIAGPFMLFPWE